MSADGKSGLQLRSLIKKNGELEISLLEIPTPEPSADEVVVRVEASPINPSDLGLLTGAADMTTAKAAGSKDAPVITARVPEAAMRAMAGRLDQSMPVGNEGAGVVIRTGSSEAAKGADGKNRLDDRRRHVFPVSHPQGVRLHGFAGRDDGGRRRVLVRQSASPRSA